MSFSEGSRCLLDESRTTMSTTSVSSASLSSPTPSPLPLLAPVSVEVVAPPPQQRELAALEQALVFLRRIDHILVCQTDQELQRQSDRGGFKVNIHCKPSSSLIASSNASTLSAECSTDADDPDVQVEHSFNDFVKLRRAMNKATSNHYPMWCEFCGAMQHHDHRHPQPSKMLRWFHDDQYICDVFSQFLTQVIEVATQSPLQPRPGYRLCEGKQVIPRLLYEFFALAPPTELHEHSTTVQIP